MKEVARCFTGWSIRCPGDPSGDYGTFVFVPAVHDDDAKVVLKGTISAGGGQSDGEQVLDRLVAHPSTARFIATKLCRRFIGDAPALASIVDASTDSTLMRPLSAAGRAHVLDGLVNEYASAENTRLPPGIPEQAAPLEPVFDAGDLALVHADRCFSWLPHSLRGPGTCGTRGGGQVRAHDRMARAASGPEYTGFELRVSYRGYQR